MAQSADKRSSKELSDLLSAYVEEAEKLSRLCQIPLSDKPLKKKMKTAGKELWKLLYESETDSQSFEVLSIPTILQSGIDLIKRTIYVLDDPIQPCSAMSIPRQLSDSEKESLVIGVKQHHQKMMRFQKCLGDCEGFPAIKELWPVHDKLITSFNTVGINPKAMTNSTSQGSESTVVDGHHEYQHCQQDKSNLQRELQEVTTVNPKTEQVCKTCAALEDSTDWTPKSPSEVTTDTDVKYSVSSTAGKYECAVTGLRWICVSDVSLEYQMVGWESQSELLTNKSYKPCGPLMDITVTSGTLEEVHLPHFLCTGSVSSSKDAVKVLHIEDSGVTLQSCELTKFHAKLLKPTFSPWGVVIIINYFFPYIPIKFHCETLIYCTRTSHLTLHVYLIVMDKKLRKAVEEDEKENMKIIKPQPDQALKMGGRYTLKASCTSKIKPASLKLPVIQRNFFDLHIKDAKDDFELYLMTEQGEKVWDIDLRSGSQHINAILISDNTKDT